MSARRAYKLMPEVIMLMIMVAVIVINAEHRNSKTTQRKAILRGYGSKGKQTISLGFQTQCFSMDLASIALAKG